MRCISWYMLGGYDRLAADDQGKFSLATFGLVVEAIDGCGKAQKTNSGWFRM